MERTGVLSYDLKCAGVVSHTLIIAEVVSEGGRAESMDEDIISHA